MVKLSHPIVLCHNRCDEICKLIWHGKDNLSDFIGTELKINETYKVTNNKLKD